MATVQTLAACLLLAANTYDVPPALMIGIMTVEGGRIGQEVGPNKNGTYDLGPMQINTRWLSMLGQHWKVHPDTARAWVRDDGCINMHVAAWILKQKIVSTGSMWSGVAAYHSATPVHGIPYAHKVARVLHLKGLLATDPENSQKRITVVEAQ
ncbi:MAG: lytic transglycosylase domain-containing protein [Alphaproteobacteria bacterium]|nr:lytic transglycosylase domain-containing protein [Alphaproteobacteria bacterium]MCL2505471.1 lytic transglycosylase domain-containing protein [Alphaproteobacteria bacterium]